MTEPTSAAEPTPDESEPLVGPPRWVKVVAVIAAALLVLFLVLQVTGKGGDHGPGRHGGAFHGVDSTLGVTHGPS